MSCGFQLQLLQFLPSQFARLAPHSAVLLLALVVMEVGQGGGISWYNKTHEVLFGSRWVIDTSEGSN